MSNTDARSESLPPTDPYGSRLVPLAMGVMLAVPTVVTFACLRSDDGALRAALILQGFADILVVAAAAVVADIALRIVARAGGRGALRRPGSHRDPAAA